MLNNIANLEGVLKITAISCLVSFLLLYECSSYGIVSKPLTSIPLSHDIFIIALSLSVPLFIGNFRRLYTNIYLISNYKITYLPRFNFEFSN